MKDRLQDKTGKGLFLDRKERLKAIRKKLQKDLKKEILPGVVGLNISEKQKAQAIVDFMLEASEISPEYHEKNGTFVEPEKAKVEVYKVIRRVIKNTNPEYCDTINSSDGTYNFDKDSVDYYYNAEGDLIKIVGKRKY